VETRFKPVLAAQWHCIKAAITTPRGISARLVKAKRGRSSVLQPRISHSGGRAGCDANISCSRRAVEADPPSKGQWRRSPDIILLNIHRAEDTTMRSLAIVERSVAVEIRSVILADALVVERQAPDSKVS
jgi:hypothetical protein